MKGPPLISQIEAVNIVGRAIFSKGWIGEVRALDDGKVMRSGLRSEDLDLIAQRGPQPGKRGGVTIEPCPQTIEAQLDRALGRSARAEAQRGRAAEWLVDHLITAHRGGTFYDQARIIKALKADPPKTESRTARGRPPITDVIAAAMVQDVATSKRTELEITTASEKNLRKWYKADPATCRKAFKIAF